MKHLHYDVIIAYANGAEIESRRKDSDSWRRTMNPGFYKGIQYRVKPTPRTPLQGFLNRKTFICLDTYNQIYGAGHTLTEAYMDFKNKHDKSVDDYDN